MATWNGVYVDYVANYWVHSFVVMVWVFLAVANFWYRSTVDGVSERVFLHHFTGMRCLASTGIVLKHFLGLGFGPDPTLYDTEERLAFLLKYGVGASGVCFFVTLSGFVTHYVYRASVDVDPIRIYYIKRLGRVLPTYYFGQVLALLYIGPSAVNIICLIFQMNVWLWPFARHTVQSAGGLNLPCWTIQALFWHWVLYPFIAQVLKRWRNAYHPKTYSFLLLGGGLTVIWGLITIVAAAWGQFALNIFNYPAQGTDWDGHFYMVFHSFPLFVLAPFLGGVIAAEVILTAKPADHWTWRWMCDCTFVLWVLLLALQGLSLDTVFSDYNYMGLLAVLLFTSAISDRSLVVRVTKHPVLVKLGDYSFHVYILQEPVFVCMAKLRRLLGSTDFEYPQRLHLTQMMGMKPGPWFVNFFVLMVLAIITSDVLEAPWVSFLRRWAKQYAETLRQRKVQQGLLDKQSLTLPLKNPVETSRV